MDICQAKDKHTDRDNVDWQQLHETLVGTHDEFGPINDAEETGFEYILRAGLPFSYSNIYSASVVSRYFSACILNIAAYLPFCFMSWLWLPDSAISPFSMR